MLEQVSVSRMTHSRVQVGHCEGGHRRQRTALYLWSTFLPVCPIVGREVGACRQAQMPYKGRRSVREVVNV